MSQETANKSTTQRIVVLSGASGSGKTVIARRCSEMQPSLLVHYFDSIEIPAIEEMIREYGSPEEWQRVKTWEWFGRLAKSEEKQILFEGQSRIEYIQSAIAEHSIPNCKLILVDCDDETRLHRLKVDRQQPELATEDMFNWASHLRKEALESDCEVLDTSKMTVEESARSVLRHFNQ